MADKPEVTKIEEPTDTEESSVVEKPATESPTVTKISDETPEEQITAETSEVPATVEVAADSDLVTASPISESKAPAQLFESEATESVQSESHHKWLLIILVLLLLIVALVGGIFYYYTQFVSNPDGEFLSPIPNTNEFKVTSGESSESAGIEEMEKTSDSDELEAIKGDVEQTNLSTVESDLKELEKSL